MSRLSSLKLQRRAGLGLALAAVVTYAASIALVVGADTKATDAKPAADKSSDQKTETKTQPKPEKKAAKKLTGAELYSIHCNRCHAERYPTEWKSTEWKTLITHMRVRANLPAAQAKEILKYLQEDSGN